MHFLRGLLISFITLSLPVAAENIEDCRLGWQATQSKQYKQALDLYEQCMEKGQLNASSKARTYRNIGITLRRMGKFESAISAFTIAIELKPNDYWGDYINRANSWSDLRQFDKAMADLEKALMLQPNNGSALYNRGLVALRMGSKAQASADFVKAYAVGYRQPEILEMMEQLNLKLRAHQNTKPPEGYSWETFFDNRMLIAVPNGWHTKQAKKGQEEAVFISKEDIDSNGQFFTGLSVFLTPDADIVKNMSIEKYIELYYATKPQYVDKVLQGNDKISYQGLGGISIASLHKDAQGDFITYEIMVFNKSTANLVRLLFEAPEETWSEVWGMGATILDSIVFDSDL